MASFTDSENRAIIFLGGGGPGFFNLPGEDEVFAGGEDLTALMCEAGVFPFTNVPGAQAVFQKALIVRTGDPVGGFDTLILSFVGAGPSFA